MKTSHFNQSVQILQSNSKFHNRIFVDTRQSEQCISFFDAYVSVFVFKKEKLCVSQNFSRSAANTRK